MVQNGFVQILDTWYDVVLVLPLALQTCRTMGKSLRPGPTNADVTQECHEADSFAEELLNGNPHLMA